MCLRPRVPSPGRKVIGVLFFLTFLTPIQSHARDCITSGKGGRLQVRRRRCERTATDEGPQTRLSASAPSHEAEHWQTLRNDSTGALTYVQVHHKNKKKHTSGVELGHSPVG